MTNHEEPPESQLKPDPIQKLPPLPPGDQGPIIEFRVGPFPPPDELRQYEELLPGFTDRSMTFIESEQRAQIDAQNQVSSNQRLQIILSGVISALTIIAGVILALLGYPSQGIIFGLGGTLLGTIRFIIGRFFNGHG